MKRHLAGLCLVFSMLLPGMICFAGDVNENIESTDWAGDLSLISDGEVSFSTDCLGYSWKGTDYDYNNLNGYPELVKIENGMKYSFAIIDVKEGMVDSLISFAVDAINAYYENKPEGCVLSYNNDAMPGFENLVGVSTGVCYPTDSPTVFSSVYALTDTNHSIAIALTVRGATEGIVKEWEENYEEGECQYSLDAHFKDILDTFWFGENIPEIEKDS